MSISFVISRHYKLSALQKTVVGAHGEQLSANRNRTGAAHSLPRSGRGDRRFKSCHSDQLHQQGADRPHLLANIEHLEARQVHKSVHRRVLRMVKLRQDSTGNYIARKRLPDDVREEYGRRFKARYEAKFFARASVGAQAAKQKFREWDAEVTARIEAIRAERKLRKEVYPVLADVGETAPLAMRSSFFRTAARSSYSPVEEALASLSIKR
jgi:hypothetical protein